MAEVRKWTTGGNLTTIVMNEDEIQALGDMLYLAGMDRTGFYKPIMDVLAGLYEALDA